ncbi:MAG: nucleotidyltransferase family protein [Nitrospirae bacterium]|nr:nucleotidyltransferase family protein [Nitrospirota bacterium]
MSKPCTKVLKTDGRPEAELLLYAARTCLDSEETERIRALVREDIDWTYLLRLALSHGVMPLLYRSLNIHCPDAVPKGALDQLQGHFFANAARNLFLTEELLKFMDLLEANGVPVIPYKGPALAASAYGNLALREFGDLDILVHERDVPRAKDLLISRGYRPNVELPSAKEASYIQFRGARGFSRGDSGVCIDLHWGVTLHKKSFSFPIDEERLWERLEPVSLGGRTVHSIPPEELLQILCVHGSRHCWEQLKWICDIAELVRAHQGLDWKRLMEEARSLHNSRMLLLGLLLARDLLGAILPEEVLQTMRADRVVKSLAAQIRERIFAEAGGPLRVFESSLFYLRIRERLWDGVPDFLQMVITPDGKDWEFLPLPESISFLYYLLRPIRLIGKYGVNPLRRSLRRAA